MKKILLSLFALLTAVCSFGADYSTKYDSNVTWTAGENAYATDKVIIDGAEYDALKLGTSKKTGSATITIPAGTKALHVHVASWSTATNTTATFTIAGQANEITAVPAGVSNNSPYTLTATTETYQVINLAAPTASETEVTVTASARVVIYGVNAETDDAGPVVPAIDKPAITVDGQTVTITGPEGYGIIYTVDGSTPADGNGTYVASNTATITVEKTTTVKAIAVDNDDPDNCSGVVTKEVVVEAFANTIDTPFTVAEALAYIEAGVGLDKEVFTKGTISSIKELSTSFGNATYFITDGTNELEIYRGYSMNGNKFAAEDEIAVGDVVIVCGKLVDYNGTKEYTTGSSIVFQDKSGREGGDPIDPVDPPYTLVGNGTVDNPYTIADIQSLYDASKASEKVWVKGTILGNVNTSTGKLNVPESAETAVASNLCIGTEDVNAPVQLPAGNVRVALNIKDNFSNIGKEVIVYGTIEKYCGVCGVKNVTEAYLEGAYTGITTVAAEAVNAGAYNLAGQKVSASFKGIAVKNGKKVVLK